MRDMARVAMSLLGWIGMIVVSWAIVVGLVAGTILFFHWLVG